MKETLNENVSPSEKEPTPAESSGEPKTEAYDFSKEFSKRGRNEMAVEIRQLRQKYMKDIPAENERLAGERSVLSEKRGAYEQQIDAAGRNLAETTKEQNEWLAAQEELKHIKEEIEKRKSSLWYKIQRRFGGGKDVSQKETEYFQKKNEAGYFNEYRVMEAEENQKRAERTGSDMIAFYDRQIKEVEDVVIDEAWHDKAKERISEFYGKQSEIKKEFGQDQEDRDIQGNAKKHNVLFLHGIPFEAQMANTSMNNAALDTEMMTSEDKALFLAGLEPTISVSSKTLNAETAEMMPERGELIYETGLIIGNGKVMSAYGEDEGTVVESLDIKGAKSGPSSIQTNIAENIAKAVSPGERSDERMTTWNELVVRNPKATGMYIMENAKNYDVAFPRVQKLAEEMHIPVIRVSRDGKMFNLTENRETTAEEVMGNTKDFSTEEKIGFIERTKKFVKEGEHPEMAQEVQKKLDALKAEKTVADQKKDDEDKEAEVRAKLDTIKNSL